MKSSVATGLAVILGFGVSSLVPVQVRAQVLEIAVEASPAGLDPHIATAFTSTQVVSGTIYEGLTAIDKDLRVVPSLAKSWTVSPDGKTYVFNLVAGATFHNGSPV